MLLGCSFSDTKDQDQMSDQTVRPSSADQNRLMSSINVSKWNSTKFVIDGEHPVYEHPR